MTNSTVREVDFAIGEVPPEARAMNAMYDALEKSMPTHASPHATGSDQLAAAPSPDDAFADLEAALTCAIRRAFVGGSAKIIRNNVDVERVPTFPECQRKRIALSPIIELTVDGNDVDAIVREVGEELRDVFARVV